MSELNGTFEKEKVVKPRAAKRQRAEANPEKILDVAMELMSEFGYAGTSMSMIRERSGYPVTSIYWHFGSKEKLLLAALERSALQAVDHGLARKAINRGKKNDGLDLIELQSRVDTEFFVEPPPFLRLILLIGLERRSSDPEVTRVVSRIRQYSREILIGQILQVIRPAGQALPRDIAEELVQMLMAFGDGLFLASELEPGVVDIAKTCRNQWRAAQALAVELMTERGLLATKDD